MFRSLSLALLGLVLLQAPIAGAALPELPRTYIDTTYSPPTGNTITVNAGGNLQAAINNAQPGDTIVLQAGATFTGPFTLPKKTGNGWIHIQSSALSSLPATGTRVSPADAANMPKIVVSDQAGAAMATAAGAHHYRFVGIEFKPVAGKFVYALIDIGGSSTVLTDLATDITIDRCYIHGDPNVGGRRGVAMNGIRVAVIDSHVSDFKEVGADTQALWTYNSPGPLKIANNYLEASGENFMAGGADPRITNLVPSDIEIRGNHFHKPLEWINQSWLVKNLFELKNAQRVLIEGNIFENSWPGGQNGMAFLITPRNQDGTAPWSATRDISIRHNKMINVGQGMNISGRDGNYTSQDTQRVLVENNLFVVTRLQGADGRIFQVIGGPVDLTIRHNTGIITVSGGTTEFAENNPKADRFDFRDNLLSNGLYGFIGTGTGPGTGTLNTYFSNYTFVANAIIGGSGTYPAGNYFPASNASVGFSDYAGGNYGLGPTSPYKGVASDGTDLGANFDTLEAATACVRSGSCAAPAAPAPAPAPAPTADTTPPVISSTATSAVTASQAVIAWTTDEASDSQVEYGLTTAYGASTALDASVVTSHSQGLSGLASATTYHYRVKSRDAAGNRATSGDQTFTTLAPADTPPPPTTDTAAPSAPTGLSLSNVRNSRMTLGWKAASDNVAVKGYRLDVATDSGFTHRVSAYQNLDVGAVTGFSITGLARRTTYYVRLRAYDAAGNASANSATVSARTN